MTRSVVWFALMVALVAVLIPYPGLIWFSLTGLALIWLVTPTSPKKGKGS